MFPNDRRRPSARAIAEEDKSMLELQARYRRAAEWIASHLRSNPDVQRIALVGSVALPLQREVPRFFRFRIHGVEILHECHDIDLAVTLSRFDRLDTLRRQLGKCLADLLEAENVGIATHQVDTFLLDADGAYVGRLCRFSACPKRKDDCAARDCGRLPFLKQIDTYTHRPESFSKERSVLLFDRAADASADAAVRRAAGPDRPRP